jgi:hypothetical protein
MARQLPPEITAVRKRKRVLFGGYFVIIVTFALLGVSQTGDLRDFLPLFLRYLAFFAVILIWTTVALIGSES